MKLNKLLPFLISLTLITGCANFGSPKTVGELQLSNDKQKLALTEDIPIPSFSFEQVLTEYRSIIPIVDDPNLAEQIERRIAGVLMMRGQYSQEIAADVPDAGYYGDVIDAYKALISKYPDANDNGEALYQLARAYDLEARDEEALSSLKLLIATYPESPWYSESLFRMGNIHFSRNRYREAEIYFSRLINRQDERWQTNAFYMNGWALFKQLLYPEALRSFSHVLERHVPDSGILANLAVVEKRLVTDTLSIMSLTLSNADGINSLLAVYPDPAPNYVWLVYGALGELYLEKERYEDAAIAYRAYISKYPTHDQAPNMHLAMIEGYKVGAFNRQVLNEKETFVLAYGSQSAFWQMRTTEQQHLVAEPLKLFLDELSRYYHAGTRDLAVALKKTKSAKKPAIQKEQTEAFGKAAVYYEAYANTFPDDPKSARMIYMAGETYYESNQYEKAVSVYEKAAYEWPKMAEEDVEIRAEAGYSAILAYNKIIDANVNAAPEVLLAWREKTVNSMLTFAQSFAVDSRASSVLSQAAEQLFELSDYARALEVATAITSQEVTDQSLLITAYSVAGLSQYELDLFAEAEISFATELTLISTSDAAYDKTIDRLAASIYQQALQQIASGDLDQTIVDLLRIQEVAPDTSIRQIAQYDAVSYLIEAERYEEAITQLNDMKQRFPNYEHAVEYDRKLAFSWEKLGKLKEAAAAYLALYKFDPDANVRREALYVAASMYEEMGETKDAIEWYLKYVFDYEKPFNLRMETRYRLAVLYNEDKNYERHLYWLRRVIDADKKAGSDRSERSQYLAAWAQAAYGDYFTMEFNRVRLTLPLEKPLARKIKALEDAQSRYELAASYNISEFSAKSSYRIAELYYQFFQDLINSERPNGLTELELEEYNFLLEDQAIPFEDQAIALHEANTERSWNNQFNEWVQRSFDSLAIIFPARYDKPESKPESEELK